MTQEEKQKIIARAMTVSGEEIAAKLSRAPENLGRALYQANCVRRELLQIARSARNEASIVRFENAVKGAA